MMVLGIDTSCYNLVRNLECQTTVKNSTCNLCIKCLNTSILTNHVIVTDS